MSDDQSRSRLTISSVMDRTSKEKIYPDTRTTAGEHTFQIRYRQRDFEEGVTDPDTPEERAQVIDEKTGLLERWEVPTLKARAKVLRRHGCKPDKDAGVRGWRGMALK